MFSNHSVAEFVTCRPNDLELAATQVAETGVAGIEVFMDDIVPRTQKLAANEAEFEELADQLRAARVARVHCSYWGSPTAFVANIGYRELVERFDSREALGEYYGDATGAHMFNRWCEEYRLAKAIGARAYVFHLIDYLHVDGAWEFSVSRETVLEAMIIMLQRFLRELSDRGLIDANSPIIELENAGWGLEFGAQTAEDFAIIFDQIDDEFDRVRIGWDMNHMLHATGEKDGRAAFLLPDVEITDAMHDISEQAAGDAQKLSELWIAHNVLHPKTAHRVSALHLSDCPAKTEEYFRNGKLQGDHFIEGSAAEKGAHGLEIVLAHYDNHVVIGDGVLDPAWVAQLVTDTAQASSADLMVLHELKNETDIWQAVTTQRERLNQNAVTETH